MNQGEAPAEPHANDQRSIHEEGPHSNATSTEATAGVKTETESEFVASTEVSFDR